MGKIVETVSFDLSEVKAINPTKAPAIKLKGQVNAGASFTRGNTDTETYHVDGELVARTAKNRSTVGGEFNRAKDDGDGTVNNALGFMKYDHFLTPKWYLYSNALFEHDEFKDLNLRTALGAGVGHQFFETTRTSLAAEAGLAYINEDFDEAGDDHYPAGRWAVDFDRYLYREWVQFFHFHEGFIGLEDTNDIFVRSRTGLRFPLYSRFTATTQYNWDWDNSPAPDREKVDEMVLFSLGYHC
jgi:putative salt-induced outer membrane protein YdiY